MRIIGRKIFITLERGHRLEMMMTIIDARDNSICSVRLGVTTYDNCISKTYSNVNIRVYIHVLISINASFNSSEQIMSKFHGYIVNYFPPSPSSPYFATLQPHYSPQELVHYHLNNQSHQATFPSEDPSQDLVA